VCELAWGQKTGFAFEMHLALTTLPRASALASDDEKYLCAVDFPFLQAFLNLSEIISPVWGWAMV
jgi:hypothetical protein